MFIHYDWETSASQPFSSFFFFLNPQLYSVLTLEQLYLDFFLGTKICPAVSCGMFSLNQLIRGIINEVNTEVQD